VRLLAPISAATIAVLLSSTAGAQPGKEDPEFLKSSPTVGEMFPDLTVYSADGKEFKTSSLRGHYTVVAFGCLT
jgi:cytochrome oxidase Cu insertion factor (SCO1/SenC/PrrC family)